MMTVPLTGNAEFDAAAYLLRSPILARRCAERVHQERQWIDFAGIADEPWSGGEWLVLDVALDLWNGGGQETPMALISRLDDDTFEVVMEAIWIRRGRTR